MQCIHLSKTPRSVYFVKSPCSIHLVKSPCSVYFVKSPCSIHLAKSPCSVYIWLNHRAVYTWLNHRAVYTWLNHRAVYTYIYTMQCKHLAIKSSVYILQYHNPMYTSGYIIIRGTFNVLSLLNSMEIIDNSLSLTIGYQHDISNHYPLLTKYPVRWEVC